MWAQLGHRWCEILARMQVPKFGITDIARMTVGKTEIHTGAGRIVQFIARQIITHFIATVVGEPQFFGLWIPIEANRITDAARNDFWGLLNSIHLDARDVAVHCVGFAIVAWSTDWDIKKIIRTKRDEFPAVMSF